ncbi:hypothetical protein jhhlp_002927 [Lomentospora prolificans]|uniref:GED domain-containing protein n=1 Tax=Lomentospora prolificans TaxID=41688 RepID=A0A2N3NFA6_9PEZI|nr:hypothetical protein jhhlp_002927 [Lomentospora prolificans]
MPVPVNGLGNLATLAKIDRLRELNVGATIPLPQLVVVGDQSSGKSSVLESLTGFSFPRAAGLCTRYATQITCSRVSEECVDISIIPRPDADEALKERLISFHRRLTHLDNTELAKVFEEANQAMGINMSDGATNVGGAFSEDILKIVISGPEQEHLTVIDVPGIFRLTTDSDIQLVENIVKSYMANSRTIILAVMPCNVDSATQEILKLAEAADPEGVRTMGVLTKPDLATEMATRSAVIDLVLGKGSSLTLGYYVVKNRSADDNKSTLAERAAAERAFFMDPAWSSDSDRCGIATLKARLHELLTNVSNHELPHVKSDIQHRLSHHRERLEIMGPSRHDHNSQRLFLAKLTSKFQEVNQAALHGYYTSDRIFKQNPDLKLMTRIIKLNEVFSNVFWKRGHMRSFPPSDDDKSESTLGSEAESLEMSFDIALTEYPELSNIIRTTEYICPKPFPGSIATVISEVYEANRGPELGTFGGAILTSVFEEQSRKWEPLVLSHVSKVIVVVHGYITQLLEGLCPETNIRDKLWGTLLVERLCDSYQRAMAHARFLLDIERGGMPTTFNHYFNALLQKKRSDRVHEYVEKYSTTIHYDNKKYVLLNDIKQHAVHKSNADQICEDILDCLVSYYKVARKRFVDIVCQQVVSHFLLYGKEGPLRVLDTHLIMNLNTESLEAIAGEDAETKRQRQSLARDIERLEEALKVLRV